MEVMGKGYIPGDGYVVEYSNKWVAKTKLTRHN